MQASCQKNQGLLVQMPISSTETVTWILLQVIFFNKGSAPQFYSSLGYVLWKEFLKT